ncbi:lauroyl-Kdo(2)-lipid IV(A) myristoyltransferase [Vibrio sp. SS-MA-C1-2]|uniref:lauroyl-Kdo(2)-lipid IV(A) myristoyltransferase n=1 Tax=Vibrio sp. SS-MA-C1-2 TaxID=2908646 RepID=UPI001EEAAEDE|nr:lauroyl-Kdo(2)-lipid IV(A) myristoyltransferase [Vibrio sp. SS-MA-C1-2]UJF17999.1 lauroyl-Kdo(2)-lipid IV(A) myristoyltransferase [Vibrio sp. SS-MA-C1-2]
MVDNFDKKAYHPRFSWHYLRIKYWGTWLGILVIMVLSLLPFKARLSLSRWLAKRLMKFKKGVARKIRINLLLCFPEKSHQQREEIVFETLVTAGFFLMSFPLLTVKSKEWLAKNTDIHGIEHVKSLREQNKSVILLVPHTWAIDIPAVLLASKGLPVSAMAKKQKNELVDWMMHKQRVQYGGRVYERSGGVKPFIKSIRDGYLGYYLPDEDLGAEHSVFVDFFATTKATMSGLGRISKVSRAEIVPLFAKIDPYTGRFAMDFYPALPFPTDSEEQDARMMNETIEKYIGEQPEQYMWILKFLKTRPNNGKTPYNKKYDQF